MLHRTTLMLLMVGGIAACATIPPEEEALLTGDIDCERAERTIEAIRESYTTDIDRARILATSLTPAGLAYGVATGDMAQRDRVLSGRYDDQLRERVRVVARECDIPVPELEDDAEPAS